MSDRYTKISQTSAFTVSKDSDFETKKTRSLRNELREVDLLLEDVLIYRSCREGAENSEKSIDTVAEELIASENCRETWNLTDQAAYKLMAGSYNNAVKKLKAIPEADIPERRAVPREGSVSMYDRNGPSIDRHTQTRQEAKTEKKTDNEETSRPEHLTSYYEELTENAAILGYHLETLAREPSEPFNEDDLEPHPKDWMY
ncbi:hypothetical protein [Candidatus Nanohalococcus occultus]|uniref:hypothetical protein n=1 Tax=Candidatus Nanohalococcus occultus TaxID=2978047 RepID=UPI0039DF812B